MKTLLAGAAIALLAAAAPALAQNYAYPPPNPGPLQQPPSYDTTGASWTQDDGSSSDYPVPMPGDVSGDRLNAQYQGGIDVAPPGGLPAPYVIR